jgi:hypothetical protein
MAAAISVVPGGVVARCPLLLYSALGEAIELE